MPESLKFGIVVLAAGASTRMGTPKQLLPWKGRSLIRHATDVALASPAWPVVVVLGAQADLVRAEIVRAPVIMVENPNWADGLSSSIRLGISVLESFSLSLEAALFVLCDQPALSPATIARLVAEHQRSRRSIVASQYGDHPGPPALFTRRHFPELLELSGSEGARPLFRRHASDLATVELPELAVDLDTPADYQAFVARNSR